jgi:hypothetical protein
MKGIFAIILLLGILASPVMAMVIEEPLDENKVTEQPTLLSPKEISVPIYHPIFNKKTVVYAEETSLIQKMVTTFSDLLGLKRDIVEEQQTTINVEIDNAIIAIIPQESKFNGLEIHDYCMRYQYGTTNWYECEEGYKK